MIRLDLNNPEFQANLLKLEKQQSWAVLQTLRLLQAMTWSQVEQSKGLRWELIQSRQGPKGERLYSLRISRGCRAVAWRDGEWLRLLSLHQFVEQGLNDRTAGPHEQRSRATLPQVQGPLPIEANKLSNAGLFELLDA